MASGKVKFKIEGMEQIERDMKRLGKVPQVAVNRAAKAGAKVALNAARKLAPKDSGALRRGLKLQSERRRTAGKKFYQVVFNANMTDTFVKEVKNPTAMNRSDDPTRAYYPSSQEFGFYNHWAGKFIQGKRYMVKSIDNNVKPIERAMLETLGKEIDRALQKG